MTLLILHRARFETPLGKMVAVATDKGLCALEFAGKDPVEGIAKRYGGPIEVRERLNAPLRKAFRWIRRYFQGDFRALSEVPLDLGGTAFEKNVWKALLDIPPGSLSTYGRLAQQIGRPRAARAVGGAVGRNPIGIIVPCHRIIGTSSTLTGYAGGLHRKQWLLAHEGFDVLGRVPASRVAARRDQARH